MQKLTALSILAETIMFEVGTNFSFIVQVEHMLISKFVLMMGKGALPNQILTDSLKGQ